MATPTRPPSIGGRRDAEHPSGDGVPTESPTTATGPPRGIPSETDGGVPRGATGRTTGGPGDAHADAQGQRSASHPAPAATGHGASAAQLDNLSRPTGHRKRLLLLVPILLVAVGAGLLFGYRYWYESTYFVITDNAQITGDLVQVGSLNAGRIVATRLEIGAPIRAGQELAVVAMPQQVGSTTAGTGPRLDVLPTTDTLVSVQAPVDGVVAARTGHVGATVAAGQPIYLIVDPRKVWIRANIEESKVWMIQPGQRVAIHVDALNREIGGRVVAITPASAATFSLLPSGNVSGNFVKVTQYVPVKIVPDEVDTILPLGTSVEVRIQIRESTEELPLPWRP
ncbi:MAG: efflux RND transporter periplasmic adaptor subunit [Chloroflexota bacterium]|nr:efflux RND transporter periplasmic adaptor subunit [Chloroflexota bacterium]